MPFYRSFFSLIWTRIWFCLLLLLQIVWKFYFFNYFLNKKCKFPLIFSQISLYFLFTKSWNRIEPNFINEPSFIPNFNRNKILFYPNRTKPELVAAKFSGNHFPGKSFWELRKWKLWGMSVGLKVSVCLYPSLALSARDFSPPSSSYLYLDRKILRPCSGRRWCKSNGKRRTEPILAIVDSR